MNFIINTNTKWDAPPRARHQITQVLSEKYRVHFVAAAKFGLPKLKIMKVNENLRVIVPSFPLDSRIRYRIPFLNELYQLWLFSKLKKHFNAVENVYVLCSDFTAHLINNYFRNVAYYCNDDFIHNIPSPRLIKRYHTYTQNRLIRKSCFTIVTARYLFEKFSLVSDKVHEIPLGAPKINVGIQVNNQKAINKIKVVLLGYLNIKKTPVDLLNRITNELNAHIILIGPVEDNILELLDKPQNVSSTGTLTGNKLYHKMAEADVAIAPYFIDDPNLGRTPNKLWQYLAVGKPVVVTNLPNIKHWKFPEGFVYKANNHSEFIEYIKLAYQKDNQHLIDSRMQFAKQNSWENRTQEIIKLYITYCN